MDAIRAQTPPELQYLVDDGFNRIVLYDNTAVSATSEKTPNGKYKVTLEVQARKVQADGNGAETPLPLADYIEIGVFSGKKDEEKPLYLKKEKLTEERKTFEIIVDHAPTLAGIDPYNKLIDRNADDNMIDITRRRPSTRLAEKGGSPGDVQSSSLRSRSRNGVMESLRAVFGELENL